jgi:hypothetical protein
MLRDAADSGLTSPMAIFSAHIASPPPPSRTPAGSRASSRHASIAPRTTSVRGPLAWALHGKHAPQEDHQDHAAWEISDFVKSGRYGLIPVGGVKVDPADHSGSTGIPAAAAGWHEVGAPPAGADTAADRRTGRHGDVWLCRLLAQFVAYDCAIWRGDRFRTLMHVACSLLWCYITATYGIAFLTVRN